MAKFLIGVFDPKTNETKEEETIAKNFHGAVAKADKIAAKLKGGRVRKVIEVT